MDDDGHGGPWLSAWVLDEFERAACSVGVEETGFCIVFVVFAEEKPVLYGWPRCFCEREELVDGAGHDNTHASVAGLGAGGVFTGDVGHPWVLAG